MLAQSEQNFNGTGLRHWPVFFFPGVHFRLNVKADLRIFRFDIHRWSLIVSHVNDLMYLFSLVLIRKTLAQVFVNDVISIAMTSAEVIEGE